MQTDYIKIKNFKSIKDLELKDCKRINLLIGPPNVGKSNILEALSLFDIPFYGSKAIYRDILKEKMRLERPQQLFPYGNYQKPVEVAISHSDLRLNLSTKKVKPEFEIEIKKNAKLTFDSSFINKEIEVPDVLVYYYPNRFNFYYSSVEYLLPPYGSNLMQVIKDNPSLREELTKILDTYGLTNVYDSASEEFKAFKKEDGLSVYMIPFEALADSLKHLIFYKAAIISNKDRIICFEEPESNTFPPYINNLTEAIVSDLQNQYFISTHSPYVINNLLETAGEDLAIYKIGIDSGFTNCYRLTEKELQRAFDYGIDFLFNIETFPIN